ncbi:MAG: ubiquinone/menaquinone biosynthesis methyltransferase [Candidatus Kapaibacterium sp.]
MSEAVRSMFAGISGRYDLMNSVITLGMHQAWRRRAVALSGVKPGDRVLDCASGTGDFALAFADVTGTGGHVTATDFCREMLDYLPAKVRSDRHAITIELADAMSLHYASGSYDVVSIAYGIRNVDDPRVALSEMIRVLKPGGRLVVIETGQPSGLMKFPFALFRPLIPVAGRLIAGNSDAYSYLPRTAREFPYGSAFASMVKEHTRVRDVRVFPLFFGVSYIYVATVD